MGARPVKGERRGGRQVGARNLVDVERELIAAGDAEREFSEARSKQKKLAKEVMADFMQVFTGIAVRYQPLGKDGEPNPDYDEAKFERWSMNALTAAKWLAPYQSPTFKQITLSNPQPERTQRQPGAKEAVAAILDTMADALRQPPILSATYTTIEPVEPARPITTPTVKGERRDGIRDQ